MDMQWYVIHTYSGHENKVRASLQERLTAMGFADRVEQILVPTEDVVEVKGGKRRVSSRKFFPGYLLIEMDMGDDVCNVINDTPKVTGFLGGGNSPLPLSPEEVEHIREHMRGESTETKHLVEFELGENVRVVDGPFSNFTGVIREVNPERGKLKVMVSIFGRATPVELDFLQVERV